LNVSSKNLKGNQTLKVSVELKNSGKYDGAEIVQLYIRDLVGSNTRPVKELKGFQKVFLKAGETKTVTFNITPEDLKFYDNNLKYDWESGEFEFFVGGDSQKTVSQKITWNK
jgi:beta-glucosidase